MNPLQRFLKRFWPRPPKGGAFVITTVYWGGVRRPVAPQGRLQCLFFAPCSGQIEEENQMTVQELIEALLACPSDQRHKPVAVWLPGSRIDPIAVMHFSFAKPEVWIEGAMRDGSALSDIVMRD